MSERATPFYCPFCGEEDLRPENPPGEAAGQDERSNYWLCFSCRRVFAVTFAGLRLPQGAK